MNKFESSDPIDWENNTAKHSFSEWSQIIGFDAEKVGDTVVSFYETVILNGGSLDWSILESNYPELTHEYVSQICQNVIEDKLLVAKDIHLIARIHAAVSIGNKLMEIAPDGGDRTYVEAMCILVAEKAMSMGFELKDNLCTENSGPCDMPPFLVYIEEDGLEYHLVEVYAEDETQTEENVDVYQSVQHALNRAYKEYGKPSAAILVSDIYVRDYKTFAEIEKAEESLRPLALRDDFAKNPSSDVYEALCAVMCSVDYDDPLVILTAGYGYGDDGMPEYKKENMFIDELKRSDVLKMAHGDRGQVIISIHDFMASVAYLG